MIIRLQSSRYTLSNAAYAPRMGTGGAAHCIRATEVLYAVVGLHRCVVSKEDASEPGFPGGYGNRQAFPAESPPRIREAKISCENGGA